MATITFGNFPVDMRNELNWGLEEFVSDQDLVPGGIPTSTSLLLVDPGTGSTFALTGSFDVLALLNDDPSTSTMSGLETRTAGGDLLFLGQIDPPLELALLFSDEANPFVEAIAGDDSIDGGSADDILHGGPGNDTAVYTGARSEYTVSSSGVAIVVSGGNDGTDTLYFFENIQFADQQLSLEPVPLPAAPSYNTFGGFLFNDVYYLLNNPDLVGSVAPEDAFQHYLDFGAAVGLKPNDWFDPTYYHNRWPDLAGFDDATLFQHYNLYGVWEGRSAGPEFDTFDGERYLSENPDVAAYVNAHLPDFLGSQSNGAIAHYVIYGANEQRLAYDTGGELIDLGWLI